MSYEGNIWVYGYDNLPGTGYSAANQTNSLSQELSKYSTSGNEKYFTANDFEFVRGTGF